MNHLNEDKLIQYAFNLMDTGDKETVQQHLDDCGQCRNALETLKTKFELLDTLADEVPPSEELIAQTVSVKNKAQNIPLYRRRWVEWSATAAAVAIVCFLMLQNLPNPQVREPAPGVLEETQFAAKLDMPKQKPSVPFPDDRMASLSSEVQDGMGTTISSPPAKGKYPEGGRGFDVRVVSTDEIPDAPPFAPASAIELVVLPKPDKTQVTIYNSKDLTLVRDTRKLTLKPGWNWIQFMWANTQIDPTSLSLTPLEHADKVDIQLISYPARLKDVGRWLIRSEVEGAVPFEITYFASGLSWRAFYMGTMNENETTMDLKGYVNVSNNSGQDFENTQTRLIVGETRLTKEIRYLAQRRYPYGPDIVIEDDEKKGIDHTAKYNWRGIKDGRTPILEKNFAFPRSFGAGLFGGDLFDADGIAVVNAYFSVKDIEKTGLSEYFLYTIEGTENLTNQWTKRLPSFDVNDIPVKSLYKYDDARYGKQAVRFVSFKNDAEHELGDTPIPKGAIKIYRNINELQNLSYIGQSNVKYIPVNEDIELNLGPARLVKVEPVLTKTKTENYTFNRKGNIDGWDDIESYKVTITNTRDIPIDIEITWNMDTNAWELDLISSPPAKGEYPEGGRGLNSASSVTYKKHDKNRARFTMMVQPQSEKVLPMIIRKYRQKRIEAYVEKERGQKK